MEDTAVSFWTPERMMMLRQVSSVRPSPDGQRIAYILRDAVMESERSDYRSQIYLAPVAGGDPIALTSREAAAANPQWSPAGDWIAFTSGASGRNSLMLIPATGGQARQLTDVPSAISSFKWSADGRWIAFTALDPPLPQREQAMRQKDDAWVVGEDPRMQRLYRISVRDALEGRGMPQRLTAGSYTVGVADVPGAYDWLPDGRTIAFSHSRTPNHDDWLSVGISLVNVESGEVCPLLCEENTAWDPHASPDGQWVACKVYDRPAWEWSSVVHLLPLAGGRPRPLAATYDRRPDIIGWAADGRRIIYAESCGTRTRICALPVDGSPPEVLYEPEGVVSDVALNGTRTACGFTLESPSAPPEAHVSRLDVMSPVQVSRANKDFRDQPLGRTVPIHWPSEDGLRIEGLLTYPVDARPGARYPLIVSVHGGPATVFSQQFVGRPSIYGALAAFSERGYAVLRCNVRGSTGYGKTFRRANYRDWGGMDYRDLMTGVDHVIAMGVADPDRLGILGWSYGGYLAAWATTQTRRFRAAVVGAAISNLISNAGTCDSPSFTVSHFGGELWQAAGLLSSRSPVLHVSEAATPTLILHGEEDQRVPLTQGRELFNALKRSGCQVQMVVYPRTGHVPDEPKLLLDVMARTLAWMDRYVPA